VIDPGTFDRYEAALEAHAFKSSDACNSWICVGCTFRTGSTTSSTAATGSRQSRAGSGRSARWCRTRSRIWPCRAIRLDEFAFLSLTSARRRTLASQSTYAVPRRDEEAIPTALPFGCDAGVYRSALLPRLSVALGGLRSKGQAPARSSASASPAHRASHICQAAVVGGSCRRSGAGRDLLDAGAGRAYRAGCSASAARARPSSLQVEVQVIRRC
jgi:hypothetical protein